MNEVMNSTKENAEAIRIVGDVNIPAKKLMIVSTTRMPVNTACNEARPRVFMLELAILQNMSMLIMRMKNAHTAISASVTLLLGVPLGE